MQTARTTNSQNLIAKLRRRYFGPITRVVTADPVAALTFDDGPNPVYTPALLDVLERHGAKATFFMVGETARRHPELLEAVGSSGHCIANHSYSHCDFLTVNQRRRYDELRACSRALGDYEAKLFRPPFGRENLASHFAARRLGYRVIKWSISTGDWSGVDSEEIDRRMRVALHPGAIILLHDSSATDPEVGRFETVQAVDRFLGAKRDYRFVTLPDLLACGRPLSS